MTLTQILQKIRAAFYTRAEIDSMGGGASLDTTIRSKANASDLNNYLPLSGGQMTGSLTAPSFIANGIDCSVDSQGANWIRYSSGLQICWGAMAIAWLLREQYATISFAKSFKGIPSISLSHERRGYTSATFSEIYELSESNFAAAYIATHDTNPDGTLLWLAIGRWK